MNDRIDEVIVGEIRANLWKGATVAGIIGLIGTMALVIKILVAEDSSPRFPIYAGFVATSGCFAAAFYCRVRQLSRLEIYSIASGIIVVPPAFFLATIMIDLESSAGYLFGPFEALFFFMNVLSGFLFNARFCVIASIFSTVCYLLIGYISMPALQSVAGPAEIIRTIVKFEYRGLRAIILFSTGICSGLLAVVGKHLIVQMTKEITEKEKVRKLFGTFVNPEVAAKLEEITSANITEKREMAVLFSDIRGFTAFSEKVDPQIVVNQLNEYFGPMVRSINGHGGMVDKFIGDAIMAVFGGVVELADPCDQAVHAAIAMRRELLKLRSTWIAAGATPFDNGIGIHYGEVIQGTLGSEDRQEFTVIGNTVNVASRVEGLCKDHGCAIIITGTVFERLRSEELRIRCFQLPESRMKGVSESIKLYGVHDDK